MARFLQSRMRTRGRSALHRLRWRERGWVGPSTTLSMLPILADCADRDVPASTRRTKHSTSSTPSPRRPTLLLLAENKQACESSDGGRNDFELDPSAQNEKEVRRDEKEGEADDEKEEPDNESVKNSPPLPRPAKKGCLYAAEKKPALKRCIKRRRFSSPLLQMRKTETRDESCTNF